MKRHKKNLNSTQEVFGFLYREKDKDQAYYFVLTTALRKTLLKAKLKQHVSFNVDDYGVVLAAGYGAPSEAEKNMLRDYYDSPI